MTYDAIVIGAGHNGLAAAVHLAKKGWKVAVVEANSVPGGAVRTGELTLPGFRHDLCAMNLSMFAGSPFLSVHRADLEAHGLAFVPVQTCFASVFRDGTALGVSTDLDQTASAIAALSPEDAAAWRAMVTRFGADAPHIFALLGAPMPSFQGLKAVWRGWRANGTGWLIETARLLLAAPRDFLDQHFRHPHVKAMMAAWGMHLDFPPDAAGGALFPYLESMADQSFGMVIGRGGADVMIRAMVSLLKACGAEILTDARVVAVGVEGGRATSVRLQDGRELRASRAVISNIHPKHLADALPSSDAVRPFADAMQKFRAAPGTMMIHLALDALPDWRAGEHLKRFAYVHIAPDMAMMSVAYAEAKDGLLPREPVIVVGQPTALDPTRAPEGRHTLWVQVRVLPAEIAGDAAGTISATDWDQAKDAYADRVMALLETYAPGLSSHILARAVQSPLDLERGNANLIGGDNLTGSHHLDQNFLFRPAAGYSRYRTPVKGLYQCGAATWPGAGTGAGSGFMVAKLLAGE